MENINDLAEVQSTAHIGTCKWDLVENKLTCSDEIYRIFGWEPGEVEASFDTFIDRIHPDDVDRLKQDFQDAIDGKNNFVNEHRIIRVDGKERVILTRGIVHYDDNGKPLKLIGMDHDITERKRVEEKVQVYQKKLQSLASELSLSEERERRRIATELHDYIGQSLAISRIKLKTLQESGSSADLDQSLEEILKLIEQAIKHTRSLMFELSPPMLYDLGFESAIEWLTEQINKQHGISTFFKDDKHSKPLDDEIGVVLFQAVRELLVNVVKHGQASSAKVSIRKDGNNIRIDVKDDGIGFDTSKTGSYEGETGGFGLFNIRERLSYLGGSLKIKSKSGKGTFVTLVAPLKKEEVDSKDSVR
jgi:PAS domain S-box-containing protein